MELVGNGSEQGEKRVKVSGNRVKFKDPVRTAQ